MDPLGAAMDSMHGGQVTSKDVTGRSLNAGGGFIFSEGFICPECHTCFKTKDELEFHYNSREHLKVAQQYFQLLGASASECDTIPGRQCMASCFFILRQFDDVLVYLSSIEAYFPSDPTFLYNFAIAKAAAGDFLVTTNTEQDVLEILLPPSVGRGADVADEAAGPTAAPGARMPSVSSQRPQTSS